MSGIHLSAYLYERLLRAGNTRAAVRAQLGEPKTATDSAVPNRHVEDQVDTLVHWSYDASDYTFIVAAGRDLLLARRVSVADSAISDCTTKLWTPEGAASTLGLSFWTDTTADTVVLRYEIPIGPPPSLDNVIALRYVRGRLVQVVAAPYVD